MKLPLGNNEEEPEVSMSPLIDCVFLLLIFFLVSTMTNLGGGCQAQAGRQTSHCGTGQRRELLLGRAALYGQLPSRTVTRGLYSHSGPTHTNRYG